MATFPDDIWSVIFLWFPAKSLARFRCVCKSWNSLLMSPFFIEAYHETLIKLHKFHLLKYDIDNLPRAQIHYTPGKELSNLDISFLHNGKDFKIVGSCNGIVCLSPLNSKNSDDPRIFLWNPSTGENIALPRSQPFHGHLDVGFGFDPSNGHLDDFRVVKIRVDHGRYGNITSDVEVYSFKRNCWEQLGDIFLTSIALPLGDQVIFKNFICWSPSRDLFRCKINTLILFDVVENVFQKLALPDILPPQEKRINLHNGCLSLIVENSSTTDYEVWIMNEFGVRESWTKLYTVDVSGKGFIRYRPVGFADSGDVFFLWSVNKGLRQKSPAHLVLYNVQREQFEPFGVEINSYYRRIEVVTCVESLIFLSPINNVEHWLGCREDCFSV